MSCPEGPSITELRAAQKKVADAAYAVATAAALASVASAMFDDAASAAADIKTAVDNACATAGNVRKEAARDTEPPHITAADPTTSTIQTAEASPTEASPTPNDSQREESSHPTQPKGTATLSCTHNQTTLTKTLYLLLCIGLAAGMTISLWKIKENKGIIFAIAAAYMAGIDLLFHRLLYVLYRRVCDSYVAASEYLRAGGPAEAG